MNDPVPGLTVYDISMAQARELPGPQQDIDDLRSAVWSNLGIVRAAIENPGVFGRIVVMKRRRLRLSQQDLALEVGCARQSISELETGIHAASGRHMAPLIRVLGITLHDIKPLEARDEAA